jgi:hypothetical protein
MELLTVPVIAAECRCPHAICTKILSKAIIFGTEVSIRSLIPHCPSLELPQAQISIVLSTN